MEKQQENKVSEEVQQLADIMTSLGKDKLNEVTDHIKEAIEHLEKIAEIVGHDDILGMGRIITKLSMLGIAVVLTKMMPQKEEVSVDLTGEQDELPN